MSLYTEALRGQYRARSPWLCLWWSYIRKLQIENHHCGDTQVSIRSSFIELAAAEDRSLTSIVSDDAGIIGRTALGSARSLDQ